MSNTSFYCWQKVKSRLVLPGTGYEPDRTVRISRQSDLPILMKNNEQTDHQSAH